MGEDQHFVIVLALFAFHTPSNFGTYWTGERDDFCPVQQLQTFHTTGCSLSKRLGHFTICFLFGKLYFIPRISEICRTFSLSFPLGQLQILPYSLINSVVLAWALPPDKEIPPLQVGRDWGEGQRGLSLLNQTPPPGMKTGDISASCSGSPASLSTSLLFTGWQNLGFGEGFGSAASNSSQGLRGVT